MNPIISVIATALALTIPVEVALSAPRAHPTVKAQSLPPGRWVKDDVRRTYRFTIDYMNADVTGHTGSRQRLVGYYTRGLPYESAEWTDVTEIHAAGDSEPFSAPQKREYMAPFRYSNRLTDTMKPDFFAGFPPMAVAERNLIWDTGMIEMFGRRYLSDLQMNVPFHVSKNSALNLPGVGSFQNRDVVLEWIGRSRLNGQECALISYEAFMNPLEVAVEGMKMEGRSEYWGLIWVSLATRQIERATLHERVVGQLQLAGAPEHQVVNVFRSGVLEPADFP